MIYIYKEMDVHILYREHRDAYMGNREASRVKQRLVKMRSQHLMLSNSSSGHATGARTIN